jgi:predicted TPR repeat methyltransferase
MLRRNRQTASDDSQRGSRVSDGVGQLASGVKWLRAFADEVVQKCSRLTETNYELGLEMARNGRIGDAIFRFRITLMLAPDHEPTLYNLGCLLQHRGEKDKALALFTRILRKDPTHANALYRVTCINPAMLKPELRPTTVPPIQVMEYFDTIAPFYDADMQAEAYRLPLLMHQLVHPELQAETMRGTMLDVGCGTGLVGVQFKETFKNMVGVDMSARMLEAAYQRLDANGMKIYNQIINQDIRHYLAAVNAPSFNLVTIASVLPYIGELSLLCEQLGKTVINGGLVAVSFDPLHGSTENYSVLPATGYFGHQVGYVSQCFIANGFEVLRTGELQAATGKMVELCLFRKKAPDAASNS